MRKPHARNANKKMKKKWNKKREQEKGTDKDLSLKFIANEMDV